jgi:hypothetical protein
MKVASGIQQPLFFRSEGAKSIITELNLRYASHLHSLVNIINSKHVVQPEIEKFINKRVSADKITPVYDFFQAHFIRLLP